MIVQVREIGLYFKITSCGVPEWLGDFRIQLMIGSDDDLTVHKTKMSIRFCTYSSEFSLSAPILLEHTLSLSLSISLSLK